MQLSLLVGGKARAYIDVVSASFSILARVVLRKGAFFERFGGLVDVRDDCSLCKMLQLISEVRNEQV